MHEYFKLYMEYVRKTESPEIFHFWTSLFLISSVVGRKCVFRMGDMNILLNLYVILTGPSGVRKSTAIDLAVAEFLPEHKMFRGRITEPALISHLAEMSQQKGKAEICIVAPELKTFLGTEFFHSSLVATLTDLYEGKMPSSSFTQSRGKEKILNPFINILGASTETWLHDCFGQDLLNSGFVARFIFPYSNKIEIVPIMELNITARERLRNWLKDIGQLKGTLQTNDEGKEWFTEWYKKSRKASPPSECLESYWERRHVHFLKVAALAALSDKRLNVEIKDFEFANKKLKEVERLMPTALGYGVSTSERLPSLSAKILSLLEKKGKLTRREIIKKLWRFGKAQEIDEALTTLLSGNLIKVDGKYFEILKRKEDKDVA